MGLVTWPVALLVAAVQAGQAGSAPAVRLHHLHYRVDDPAAAMNRAAIALDGTRVLLQGFGVGVRVGDQYLLFDRFDAAAGSRSARSLTPAQAYRAAADWLAARGIRVPAEFSGARLAAAAAGEALDHVAFEVDDLEAATLLLGRAGARAVRESADAAMYEGPEGAALELLRPTGVEETFWCPMHPDVRSGMPGTCPLCSMALVAIPPPRIGEYRMDVALTPARGGAGMSALRLVIRDPETGAPVPSFATVHERPFHLFIVSRTLDYFAHVHPEPAGEGTFVLTHAAPPGEYMLIADFLPHGGVSQTLQRAVVAPGGAAAVMAPVPVPAAGPAEQVVDGLRVRLEAGDLAPRKAARLQFTVTDAVTGEPVTDLEPFLGAAAHLLMVRADLTEAVHGHPEEPATAAPSVTFNPLLPAAGTYKLWVQLQRRGRVVTAPFVVQVLDR